MSDRAGFRLHADELQLPPNATAAGTRHTLSRNSSPLLTFNQGRWRNYLHPIYTPARHSVTADGPPDHPHHNGVWLGSDHVHCLTQGPEGRVEEATYCFFMDEVFQGRAPGVIRQTAIELDRADSCSAEVAQDLEWRGPSEWGAPDGRVVAVERRTTTVEVGKKAHVITLASQLGPTDADLRLGPARHAYFGVRVPEMVWATNGGSLTDSEGRAGGEAISWQDAAWIEFRGEAGGGASVGIALLADPAQPGARWFAADWGVATLIPYLSGPVSLRRGQRFACALRLVVHDGDLTAAAIAEEANRFRAERVA